MGREVETKNPLWEGYGYFLEQLNNEKSTKFFLQMFFFFHKMKCTLLEKIQTMFSSKIKAS